MIKLGVTLPQFTDDPGRLLEGALTAEELGLDSIWLFDHLWPLTGGKERPIFEGWTALAYLAAKTSHIQIGTLVTRSTLRHPALLAKMAATVAEIAPGRVVLAVGSGDELSRRENEAFGIPYFGGEDRVPQMIDTLETLRSFLQEPEVTYRSAYQTVDHLPTSPRPVAAPPLWVGGRSPEVLAAAGAWCGGWNSWSSSPKAFAREVAAVRASAGKRPVEMSWGGQVILANDDAEAHEMLAGRPEKMFLVGGPETVAGRFRDLADAGADHLISAFPYAGPASYRLLAEDVRRLLP